MYDYVHALGINDKVTRAFVANIAQEFEHEVTASVTHRYVYVCLCL